MATVHRGPRLPNMRWKGSAKFTDFQFNESRVVQWARNNLRGPMHYDFIVFNGTKGKLNREIEFVAWFANKADFEAFEKEWG